jgi:hypothetical protein
MIKVKRLSCPDVLKIGSVPTGEGEFETDDAIRFYNIPANKTLTYRKIGVRGKPIDESFSVYTDSEVRSVLVKMFKGKCAYCESKITAICSGDIEHFRPKGGYGTRPLTKPGYYWLASDWDNLLFACPFCNQTCTHKIFENGNIVAVVQGKLNQFPLKDEYYRLNETHGAIFLANKGLYQIAYNLEESERLLLKPCTDEVEKYFKYDDLGVILPASGLNHDSKERASISIEVYALQRMTLVQRREQNVIKIKAQIKRVEEAIENLNGYSSNEEQTWFDGILKKEMKILKGFTEPDEEYAGLARYIINKYFNEAHFT